MMLPRAINTLAGHFLVCVVLCAGLAVPAIAQEGQGFRFPEMRGWRLPAQPQTFSPDALYEYIDGGADLYLKYEFQELTVADYRNDGQASVTVEVYRHRDSNHAFGIYSQERLPSAEYLNIGTQGYRESGALNFVKGPYYVKISSDNTGADDQEILLAFARSVSRELAGQTSLPATLASFPSEGKRKNSEKFIAQDFLGYSFLHSGFTADYELSGKKFQIFVIEGANREDTRAMLERYLRQSGNAEAKIAEGPYRLKDPYHGEMDIVWKGKRIWGTMNLDDPDLRSTYLKRFEESSGE